MYMPEKKHLHGADAQSAWDNFLVQKEGDVKTINVVTFGPPEPRKLTVTPGVSSERPTVVSEGQVRLGENPRPTDTNQSTDDPMAQMLLMQQGYDPYATVTPYYAHEMPPEDEALPYEVEWAEREPNPYGNVSYNKKPVSSFGKRLASGLRSVSVPGRRGKKDSLIVFPGSEQGRPGGKDRRDASQNRNLGCAEDARGRSHSGDRPRLVIKSREPRSSSNRRDSRANTPRRDMEQKRVRVYHDDPSKESEYVRCSFRDYSSERRDDSSKHRNNSNKNRNHSSEPRCDFSKHRNNSNKYRDYSSERRHASKCDYSSTRREESSKHCDNLRKRRDYSSERRGDSSQYRDNPGKSQRDLRSCRDSRERQSVRRGVQPRHSRSHYPAYGHSKFSNKNSSALEPDDDCDS